MFGYGDDSGLQDWLDANGHVLGDGAPAMAVLRERGSVYVDGIYGARFSGVSTGGFAQERAWPRTGATAYGQAIGDDIVPVAVVNASYVAAWQEVSEPGSLSVSGSEASRVKREKVEGAVEVEYQASSSASAGAAGMIPIITAVDALLRRSCGQ